MAEIDLLGEMVYRVLPVLLVNIVDLIAKSLENMS